MPRDPKKINSYILFDFETGGLDKKNNLHSQNYPVTEFAAIAINGTTLEEILRYDDLVKPYDPKLIYDPIAANLTGITREMCEEKGITLRTLVENICQLCAEANIYNSKTARPILVAHNGDFDRQFWQDIFKRADVDFSKYIDTEKDAFGNIVPHIIDTVDLAKACWAEITDNTTKFKLSNCCERAGVTLADGHRAMNDVEAMADLFRYFLARLRSGDGSQVSIDEGNKISIHRKSFEW
jgi:DNA polymerase III epsilon subunit-like protein